MRSKWFHKWRGIGIRREMTLAQLWSVAHEIGESRLNGGVPTYRNYRRRLFRRVVGDECENR